MLSPDPLIETPRYYALRGRSVAGRSQGPDRLVAIMVSVRELVALRIRLGHR